MSAPPSLKDRFLQHFTGSESALRGFIASVIFTPSDRDDLLQEVALRLWQLYDRYDPSRPFTPWALGVASRRLKEECRKMARRPLLLEESHLEVMTAAFTEMAREEEQETGVETALKECLKALPAGSSSLIRSRYFNRCSIEDLSQSHGLTPAAVYQSLCRLRRRLATCIRTRLSSGFSPSTPASHVS